MIIVKSQETGHPGQPVQTIVQSNLLQMTLPKFNGDDWISFKDGWEQSKNSQHLT